MEGIESVKAVHSQIKNGNIDEAFQTLRLLASPDDDLTMQSHYSGLARKIIEKDIDLPIIKIAFLANVTLEHWVDALRFWLLLEGYQLDSYIAPFGGWRQEVLDTNSRLYGFKPDFVWFFLHHTDLEIEEGILITEKSAEEILSNLTKDIADKVSLIVENSSAVAIVNNIIPSVDRVFGNLEGSLNHSPAALLQRFNLKFPKLLPQSSIIFDISHIASKFGLDRWNDARLWYHSKHPFSFEAQGQVAFSAARLLSSTRGRARKCIVLDLDNTLWGGIIGDDGIDNILIGPDGGAVGEAYADFQKWLKALANRGIALVVCSKNERVLAEEPFEKKAGMILKLSDFAAFHANWQNKADNIRLIAQEINLGLDAMVFVDDNPAERELVRSQLPQVSVPDLPVDPSGYIHAIASGKWFETIAITKEDGLRSLAYRQNQARVKVQTTSTDLSSYLQSLEMKAGWNEVDATSLARTTQLINKTNQFNMTTSRYTERQIREFADSQNHWLGLFTLADRFGDFGIISVVILKFEGDEAIVEGWVMSCRVFSRGMEDFVFNKLCEVARQRGCKQIVGKYIPTSKNMVIAELYSRFGGEQKIVAGAMQYWYFYLNKHVKTIKTHITELKDFI